MVLFTISHGVRLKKTILYQYCWYFGILANINSETLMVLTLSHSSLDMPFAGLGVAEHALFSAVLFSL